MLAAEPEPITSEKLNILSPLSCRVTRTRVAA